MTDRSALKLTRQVTFFASGSSFGGSSWSQPNRPGIFTLKQLREVSVVLSKELYFLWAGHGSTSNLLTKAVAFQFPLFLLPSLRLGSSVFSSLQYSLA